MNHKYVDHLGIRHKALRMLWSFSWGVFASWLPRSFCSSWKRFLLRLFGAEIAPTAVVYSTARVYYPPNLVMKDYSCLASDVDCYNVDIIEIGNYSTVSQGTFLCTASHDVMSNGHELITAPIIIGDNAWIGAKASIGMGVNIGNGVVVGATASVYKSVEPWSVVGGNPAKFIKKRVLRDA